MALVLIRSLSVMAIVVARPDITGLAPQAEDDAHKVIMKHVKLMHFILKTVILKMVRGKLSVRTK